MKITDIISFKGETAFLERKGYRTYPVSYTGLKERVLKTASYLNENGVKKGNAVIIQSSNSANYASLLLACFHIGAVAVPLDIHFSEQLRRKISEEVRPKMTFLQKGVEKLHELTENLSPIKADKEAAVSEEDLAEIVYTSGTTGVPKGVMLTHGNICSNVKALQRGFKLRLRHLSVLPLSHMLEQTAGLLLPLANNSTIVYPGSYRYSDIIDLIKYKRVNAISAVPGFLDGLKKATELRGRSLHSLLGRQFFVIGVGGAPLPKELEDWWRKRVLLLQGYGLTETSPIISTNLPFAKRKYSLGKPLEGVEVRVKNGEIQARGPNVTQGYYKRPELNKELFDEGWIKTGDLGEMRGRYLYFKGRKKDIIVSPSGLNVYPQDIEEKLNRYVKESCVLDFGGKIHAVLQMDGGNPKKAMEEVNKQLEQHQKIISYSVWKGEFPKTATGKIKKFEVKEKLKKPSAWKEENELYQLLSSALNAKITKAPLSSLGMDSLKRMEILSSLEEKYGVELSESEVNERTTAKNLEELIKQKKKLHHYNFRLPKLGFLGSGLFYAFASIFCRVKCNGKTSFKGGLVVANHVSAFDVPVIKRCIRRKWAVAALPSLVGIGKRPIHKRIGSWFLRNFYPAYPFGPEFGLENSMRFTAHLLDEGYSVIVFPEGERTLDGKIHSFKEGVGYLAVNMGAEILPVKTEGLFYVLRRGKANPKFGRVNVKLGKPFKADIKSYLGATRLIEKRIKGL